MYLQTYPARRATTANQSPSAPQVDEQVRAVAQFRRRVGDILSLREAKERPLQALSLALDTNASASAATKILKHCQSDELVCRDSQKPFLENSFQPPMAIADEHKRICTILRAVAAQERKGQAQALALDADIPAADDAGYWLRCLRRNQ